MAPIKNKRQPKEPTKSEVLGGCLLFLGFLFVVSFSLIRGGIALTGFFLPGKALEKKTALIKPTLPGLVKSPIDNTEPLFSVDDSKQLISDEHAGRVLGKMHCGDMTMQEGTDYLNEMGFPVKKLENVIRRGWHIYPDLMKGYTAEIVPRKCAKQT